MPPGSPKKHEEVESFHQLFTHVMAVLAAAPPATEEGATLAPAGPLPRSRQVAATRVVRAPFKDGLEQLLKRLYLERVVVRDIDHYLGDHLPPELVAPHHARRRCTAQRQKDGTR